MCSSSLILVETLGGNFLTCVLFFIQHLERSYLKYFCGNLDSKLTSMRNLCIKLVYFFYIVFIQRKKVNFSNTFYAVILFSA